MRLDSTELVLPEKTRRSCCSRIGDLERELTIRITSDSMDGVDREGNGLVSGRFCRLPSAVARLSANGSSRTSARHAPLRGRRGVFSFPEAHKAFNLLIFINPDFWERTDTISLKLALETS